MEADIQAARLVCTKLLGPDAVQDEKTEIGRHLYCIGYSMDLDSVRATISKKNILKSVYGFVLVHLDLLMPVAYMQKLASGGSRCRSYAGLSRHFFFRRGTYSCVAVLDASLSGNGIIWYAVHELMGVRTPWGAA